ncbi:hypothetical protein B6D60_02500 [candidate division KSB1 bacterium 4484_87]|nr:MAG: hypothetical protein B6D60_02500 [candidate division KSB1 bacterium 4484_87]
MLTRKRIDFSDNRIDLHIHSNHSDGSLNVEQIFDYAQKAGLKAISITDHDNISALSEANKLSMQRGIEFVNGVEISARGENQDMHLLGYLFDHEDEALIEYVDFFKNERIKRAKKIIKNFNDLGFDLTYEEVLETAGEDASIGRPHIAYALLKKGLASSFQEIFLHYLGDGCACWVPKFKISPEDAISLIKKAGGLCILAHPDREIPDEQIRALVKVGLDGIETIHPKHTQVEVDHFRQLAREENLVESGGSDCHASPGNGVHIGKMNVPYQFLEKMKQRAGV